MYYKPRRAFHWATLTASPFYDNDGSSNGKFRPDLGGKIYATKDNRNGTNQPKLLRAVQLNCSRGVVRIPADKHVRPSGHDGTCGGTRSNASRQRL